MAGFWKRLLEELPEKVSRSDRVYREYAAQNCALYEFGLVSNHPRWTRPEWDPTTGAPLSVAAQTADIFYCSHAIEKLTVDQTKHFLKEIHRGMKPGGLFRVASLDARLCYEAYRRRDVFVNFHYGLDYPFGEPGSNTFTRETMSIWLVNQIAGQLIQSVKPGHVPIFADKNVELDAMFDQAPMPEAFDNLCGMIDPELQRAGPNHHVSWWCYEKLSKELNAAGFSEIHPSVAGGSVSPLLRDSQYFDRDIPTLSFFVEAIA